jgi:hypothetical protein
MLRFLADDGLWKELRHISKQRKRRLLVAVPYIGSNTRNLLYLRSGDVLVVALTVANAKNGSVCPKEIARLQKKGVQVFLAPDLHAKVMLCGSKAVVGSANLSQTSFKYRDEAALMTTDAGIVKNVREWFESRMSEPVTPEWLSICDKAWNPPKSNGNRPMGKKIVRQRMGRAVWLVGLAPLDAVPKDEVALQERGEAEAEQKIEDATKYEITWSRFVGCKRLVERLRKGDTWIPVWKDGTTHYVEEHGRVLGWKRFKTKAGLVVTYFYVESPRRPKKVGWGKFKQECRSAGLKLGRNVGQREITNPLQAATILKVLSKRTSSR